MLKSCYSADCLLKLSNGSSRSSIKLLSDKLHLVGPLHAAKPTTKPRPLKNTATYYTIKTSIKQEIFGQNFTDYVII